MKKIYLVLVLMLSMSFNVFAQQSDCFFKNVDNDPYNRIAENTSLNLPQNQIGTQSNESAPIGNGLLILTAVGLGYAIKKRKK